MEILKNKELFVDLGFPELTVDFDNLNKSDLLDAVKFAEENDTIFSVVDDFSGQVKQHIDELFLKLKD